MNDTTPAPNVYRAYLAAYISAWNGNGPSPTADAPDECIVACALGIVHAAADRADPQKCGALRPRVALERLVGDLNVSRTPEAAR